MFSPSGHRIYVARASGGLLVLDRVSGEKLQQVELPGPAVRDLGRKRPIERGRDMLAERARDRGRLGRGRLSDRLFRGGGICHSSAP
jgi:hypothetical protein